MKDVILRPCIASIFWTIHIVLDGVERLLHEAVKGSEDCIRASERGDMARMNGFKHAGECCVHVVMTTSLYHSKRAPAGNLEIVSSVSPD